MEFVQIVGLSTLVFAGIIFFLTAMLQLFEAKFAQKGDCKITINDQEDPVVVAVGNNLLTTLSNQKIFLPSACGGGGTCALCKCQILEGGGDILPTETGLLTRREQKDHYRLACQVKIRGDMKIHIADEIFSIQKFECAVRSNYNVATFIKELVLELPVDQSLDFQAGGYIQIYMPEYKINFKDFNIEDEYHPDWDKFDLWSLKAENDDPSAFRAYSMASHPAEKGILILDVRIATPPPRDMSLPPGIASSYIFNLKPGDKVMISGPYGEFFIKDTKREMVYIGGGAGMAPMRSHLFHLFHTVKTNRKVSYWYGARSKREMFYTEDFSSIEKDFSNFRYEVALSEPMPEDHWKGYTGFIHSVVLDNYLKHHDEPEEIEYYLCGPPLMIDAVQKMLDSLGVPEEMIAFDSFG